MSYYDHAIDTDWQRKSRHPRRLKTWELEREAAADRQTRAFSDRPVIYRIICRLKKRIDSCANYCPERSAN